MFCCKFKYCLNYSLFLDEHLLTWVYWRWTFLNIRHCLLTNRQGQDSCDSLTSFSLFLRPRLPPLHCIILHCIQPWLEEDLVYNVLYCTLYHTEKNYLFIPLQWTYIYIQIFPKNLGKLHSAQCSTFFGWDNDIWGRYLPAFAGLIVQNNTLEFSRNMGFSMFQSLT